MRRGTGGKEGGRQSPSAVWLKATSTAAGACGVRGAVRRQSHHCPTPRLPLLTRTQSNQAGVPAFRAWARTPGAAPPRRLATAARLKRCAKAASACMAWRVQSMAKQVSAMGGGLPHLPPECRVVATLRWVVAPAKLVGPRAARQRHCHVHHRHGALVRSQDPCCIITKREHLRRWPGPPFHAFCVKLLPILAPHHVPVVAPRVPEHRAPHNHRVKLQAAPGRRAVSRGRRSGGMRRSHAAVEARANDARRASRREWHLP